MRGAILASCMLTVASGGVIACNKKPSEDTVVFGLPYAFPDRHVDAVVDEGRHRYVRLRPPGRDLLIIFDERLERKQAKVARVVVAGISYSDYDPHKQVQTPGGTVVCREGRGFNCGLKIKDGDLAWSVLFKRDQLAEVADIRAETQALIASYRRAPQSGTLS
jgi:hypothetical protein